MPLRRPFPRRSAARRAIVLAFVLAGAPRAVAQQGDTAHTAAPRDSAAASKFGTLPARWNFAAGGYLPSLSTTATIGGPLLSATPIDLENALGLSANTQTIDLYASYRFKKKNMLSLEYFGYTRSATKTINDSLVVGDTVYDAGATLHANANIAYFGFTYRYYFWRREQWELGAGLGIDVMNLGVGFGIKASTAGRADSAQTSGSILAPVPLIGFYGDWEPIPDLYVRGTFQTFFLKYQEYSGSVHDRRLAVEWYPWRNYGFGAGWHLVGLSIKKTNAETDRYVQLGYSIQGLSIYAMAAFGAPQPVPPRPPTPITEPPEGQDFGLVPRNVSLFAGGFGPNVQSHGELSSPSGDRDYIDLEQTFGFPSKVNSIDLGLSLRVANKSLITASYFSFSRSGSETLTDTLHWGDATYPAGVTVDAGGSLAYLGFSYRYYFLRKTRWQLGAGIGVDEIEGKMSLGVHATVAGKEDSLQAHSSLSTPAPMLGLYFDWEPLKALYLRAVGQYISISVGSSSGTITDDRLTAEWYVFKNYGIGGGYHYIYADLSRTFETGDQFNITYTIQGPYLYLTAAF